MTHTCVLELSERLGKPEVISKNELYYRYKSKYYAIEVVFGADHTYNIILTHTCVLESRSWETGSNVKKWAITDTGLKNYAR